MKTAQWCLLIGVFIDCVLRIAISFTGKSETQPSPIAGPIGAIIGAIITLYLYSHAGALSEILK